MEQHGTNLPTGMPAGSQEIRCTDCGHRYAISSALRSGRCGVCGNIAHLASPPPRLSPSLSTAASPNLAAKSEDLSRGARELLRGALLSHAAPQAQDLGGTEEPSLEAFRLLPDGLRVDELRTKYQVEWQLWAMTVKNFSDSNFHAAYITHAICHAGLQQAGARYAEHRTATALGADTLWQAEVAEIMLERIQALSNMRMETADRSGVRLPYWILAYPLGRGVFRVAWIALGLALMMKVLGWL